MSEGGELRSPMSEGGELRSPMSEGGEHTRYVSLSVGDEPCMSGLDHWS
jgi:hypothetical protein